MISHLLSTLPYTEVPRPVIELPKRPKPKGYERPPKEETTYVPDYAATLLDGGK
jgi:hypothetical protein